jgi:hypothetical protein
VTDRRELLREFIEASQGAPVIGVDDCGPWVAKWVGIVTGKSVQMPAYRTREEGFALADAAGGLVNLIDTLLAAIGVMPKPEWVEANVGDIGVIAFSDREVPVIYTGMGHVALRDERMGVRYLRARHVVKAWSLP